MFIIGAGLSLVGVLLMFIGLFVTELYISAPVIYTLLIFSVIMPLLPPIGLLNISSEI